MEALNAFRTVIPLSFAAGLNLYLTVLVVGLSIRFGWVADVPPDLLVLASLPVLIVAGVFYVLEFFADKIPFVDNFWDLLHTFVRPVGAVLVFAAGFENVPYGEELESFGLFEERSQAIAALVASMVALTAHSGKAGTRTAVNVSSPAENITNIIISLLEDVLVAVLVFLALRYPTLANVLTIGLLLLIILLLPQMLRWAWFTLRAIGGWLRSLVAQSQASHPLPAAHADLLQGAAPALSTRCRAQNVPQASGKAGYLLLTDEPDTRLFFSYGRWFRTTPGLWELPLSRLQRLHLRSRPLLLVLEADYQHNQRERTARFVFTKDRRRFAESLLNQIQSRLAARA